MEAFEDLDAADVLELLGKAPDPAAAARLTRGQIMAALRKARRRDIETKTDRIQTALRAEQLGRAETIAAAYAATTRSAVAVLTTLNQEVKALQGRSMRILAGTRTLRSSCPSPGWDRCSAHGSSASSGTTRTVCHRQGTQELRRYQPDYPCLRQEEGRRGPVRPWAIGSSMP
ncbi:hypothetical protein [Rhodococcus opacus]|uniref:hypothetical protein n=1 Tax=Rhodococcus opacus TaxID=37919 RepID=UPI001C201E42|nr:hypothetical protein [Rhodococcus opacus]